MLKYMNKMLGAAVSIALSFTLIACGSTTPKDSILDREGFPVTKYKTEGWLNPHIFQVTTLGAPNPKARGFVRRRTQSQEAALMSAQKRVIELLLGTTIEGACGSDSGESTGCAIVKEFSGQVKGGSVMQLTYDKQDNCEMIFRIQAKDLRKQAETAVTKL